MDEYVERYIHLEDTGGQCCGCCVLASFKAQALTRGSNLVDAAEEWMWETSRYSRGISAVDERSQQKSGRADELVQQIYIWADELVQQIYIWADELVQQI